MLWVTTTRRYAWRRWPDCANSPMCCRRLSSGISTVGDPTGLAVLCLLVADADPLVRAAALQAAGELGCAEPITAVAITAVAISALNEPAWQVREGAAKALGSADPDVAVAALTRALQDPNLDVRRAAVRSLSGWAPRDDVAELLHAALADSDADVRAYARRALSAVELSAQRTGG